MHRRDAARPAEARRAILGDWGTSRLRLYLCDVTRPDDPTVAGEASGPGAKFVTDFPATFRETAARLPGHPPDCPAVLAGMVGSNIGWRETGYVRCPAAWVDIAAGAGIFSADAHPVAVLPGASCAGRFGYTDVMRGEETQLLGIARTLPADDRPTLVCLPGTHTKWATVNRGALLGFTTAVTGELYDLLRRHSILLPAAAPDGAADAPDRDAAFLSALDLMRHERRPGLAEALFSARSRTLAGELDAADAAAWLSGLLIGADVRDTGRRVLDEHGIEPPVLIVGEGALAERYARALARYGVPSECRRAGECAVRGLAASLGLLEPDAAVAN